MKFKCLLRRTAAWVIEGKVDAKRWFRCTHVSLTLSLSCREYYRTKSSFANRAAQSRDQNAEASNQVPSTARISNEINPPEVVANREAINQNKLRRNKKQQLKKALELTGNVDLDMKKPKQGRRRGGTRKATKTKPTQTTPHPNTIPEVFQPNHHRHNHYDVIRQEQPRRENTRPPTTTSTASPTTPNTPYPRTYPPATSPRARIIESTSTQAPSFAVTTEWSVKALEKVNGATLDVNVAF